MLGLSLDHTVSRPSPERAKKSPMGLMLTFLIGQSSLYLQDSFHLDYYVTKLIEIT